MHRAWLPLGALLIQQIVHVTCWMDAPYGSDSFNTRAQYSHNVTLECSDDRVSDAATFSYWIRPDLVIMKEGDYEQFWTLFSDASWRVSPDGKEMSAVFVNERQFGFYYCVVEDGGETVIIKKALNYNGPYFGNLWPTYRMNVIIGLSAAGCFVVLAIIFAIIVASCNKRDAAAEENAKPPLHGVSTDNGNEVVVMSSGDSYGMNFVTSEVKRGITIKVPRAMTESDSKGRIMNNICFDDLDMDGVKLNMANYS